MTRVIFLLALLFGGVVLNGPSSAADLRPMATKNWRISPRSDVLPFPRSERAQAVWAADACRIECGSYCAWGQTQCLERDSQGQCLKLTDKCDRYCQRDCRTSGGPLLAIEMPWD